MTKFKAITEAVFKNLNIKALTTNYFGNRMMKSQFINNIKNCHSLRSVNFNNIWDLEAQLDAVEANQNVKKWTIKLDKEAIIGGQCARLQKMISNMGYNSLYVSSYGTPIDDYLQQFRIYPVSYC